MSYPRKSSFRDRQRWYNQVDRCGKSVTEVCTIFGVSRQTYYAWRHRDFGPPRSHVARQLQPATKLMPAVRQYIVRVKERTNYGPLKMRLSVLRELSVSLSPNLIYRFYRKKGLIRRPQRRFPWYTPLKEPVSIRKPGDGVQLDVKYVYPHGRREYQFSVFDPYTEQYYFRIFPTRHSRNAVTAFQEAETYWGMRIHSVQTDNGSQFRVDFHVWCTETRQIPHYFIPKGSPIWNGKVERVHRTIDDEYYLNPHRQWRTPMDWLWYYNHERIHLTLQGRTPREYYLQKCHP